MQFALCSLIRSDRGRLARPDEAVRPGQVVVRGVKSVESVHWRVDDGMTASKPE
jgi:hypothetical protein